MKIILIQRKEQHNRIYGQNTELVKVSETHCPFHYKHSFTGNFLLGQELLFNPKRVNFK